MASPSERLAEVRAALLELEACVAKYRGVRVPRRAAPSAGHAHGSPPGRAPGGTKAELRGVAQRILRPPLLAFLGWWQRSYAKRRVAPGSSRR